MKEAFYYLNLRPVKDGELDKDNRASDKRELLVNCAGSINTRLNHTSINKAGRRDYYLIYLNSGTCTFRGGDTERALQHGDVIILPPNTSYSQRFSQDEALNYLWVHFTGSGVENVLKELKIDIFPCVNKTKEPNHLQTRFSRLFDCFLKNDALKERDLSASFEKLLVEISRAKSNYSTPRVSISKSLGYINDNYSSPIKITDLAKMEGMSMTRFNLHFKEQMKMPPTKYIIMLRINTAKELLISSDLPPNQIGAMCGYEDYNFFAKVFKSVTGVSPRKYRQMINQ